MPNQFTPVIEELRDKSDKESNKKALLDELKKLGTLNRLQEDYVKELIEQFEDLIELYHYKYIHDLI